MTSDVKIGQGSTLWGVAKRQLQEQTGQQKVSNQQIVDAMKEIAKANGYEDGDFEACAKDKFFGYKEGDKIKVPGLCIENGQVSTVAEEEAPDENTPVTAGGTGEAEETGEAAETAEAAKKNTTLGATGTLLAKGALKTAGPTIAKHAKKRAEKAGRAIVKQAKNVKGKVIKAKAQHVRNSAAAKLHDARKARDKFNAEEKKLKDLKEQRKAASQKLAAERKRSYKLDANGKKITSKKRLEARRNAKNARVSKAQEELKKLNKQISAQQSKVNKLRKAKNAALAAAKTAQKKAGKVAGKATGKAAGKAAGKEAAKVVAQKAGKAAGKSLLKKIPGVSFFVGAAFAIDRVMHGDYTGAVMEVASGAAGCIPGVGTAASVGIDIAIGAKDMHDEGVF